MREIDTQSEDRLSAALRRLATNSSQGAPQELGATLKTEFHRRHVRRRRVRIAGFTTLAACLALFAAFLLWRKSSSPDSVTRGTPAITRTPASEKPVPTAPTVAKVAPSRKQRVRAGAPRAATM